MPKQTLHAKLVAGILERHPKARDKAGPGRAGSFMKCVRSLAPDFRMGRCSAGFMPDAWEVEVDETREPDGPWSKTLVVYEAEVTSHLTLKKMAAMEGLWWQLDCECVRFHVVIVDRYGSECRFDAEALAQVFDKENMSPAEIVAAAIDEFDPVAMCWRGSFDHPDNPIRLDGTTRLPRHGELFGIAE